MNYFFFLCCVVLISLAHQSDIIYPYVCQTQDRDATCSNGNEIVCGWFNPILVQCKQYPCASNYNNPCIACKDPKVLQIFVGVCPGSSFLNA